MMEGDAEVTTAGVQAAREGARVMDLGKVLAGISVMRGGAGAASADARRVPRRDDRDGSSLAAASRVDGPSR